MVYINPSNLLPPYIQDGDEDPLTLAVLGSTIGHELTHGFDNGGRNYDKYGAVTEWWAPADTIKFNTFSEQLSKNYSALLMMPWANQNQYSNGPFTLGENIADIGGCCLGLDLLLGKYPNASPEEIKQLIKRYFQGWAIIWSDNYDMKRVQWGYDEDFHSQPRERTNGVVRNINAWYDAYDVKSGTLYLEPAKRIAIW
jgi:predicted metalloendopeptidase